MPAVPLPFIVPALLAVEPFIVPPLSAVAPFIVLPLLAVGPLLAVEPLIVPPLFPDGVPDPAVCAAAIEPITSTAVAPARAKVFNIFNAPLSLEAPDEPATRVEKLRSYSDVSFDLNL
jgi:hypothetical protein